MSFLEKFYPESKILGFTRVDGTINFYNGINALVKPDHTVLDIGCGRGEYQDLKCTYVRDMRIFKNRCQKVIGIDMDKGASENPFLDEFHLIDSGRWEVEDQSIDIAFADYVLEHVSDVEGFFSECNRVLKPGGILCMRTVNLHSYFGFISSMIPNRMHGKVASSVQDERQEVDVFPTVYKCNTKGKIKRKLKENDFSGAVYHYESEPAYFSFSIFLYFLAVMHQKFSPDFMKLNLVSFAQKGE